MSASNVIVTSPAGSDACQLQFVALAEVNVSTVLPFTSSRAVSLVSNEYTLEQNVSVAPPEGTTSVRVAILDELRIRSWREPSGGEDEDTIDV